MGQEDYRQGGRQAIVMENGTAQKEGGRMAKRKVYRVLPVEDGWAIAVNTAPDSLWTPITKPFRTRQAAREWLEADCRLFPALHKGDPRDGKESPCAARAELSE